jgi:hypothetical protein
VEAEAQLLQLGAQLTVHIGREARQRGIMSFGGAVERDGADLRRIVGQSIAAREVADGRRHQRRQPRERPVSDHPRLRVRRRAEGGSRLDIVCHRRFERVAFRRHGPSPSCCGVGAAVTGIGN